MEMSNPDVTQGEQSSDDKRQVRQGWSYKEWKIKLYFDETRGLYCEGINGDGTITLTTNYCWNKLEAIANIAALINANS